MSSESKSNQVRAAIYTRKSAEEGLEQEFNSLHAQRESAEAYIKSQQHEGWQLVPNHYDDGGFTGGNMDRPALKRLLADIEAGKVNMVVVYKVDRFSRSHFVPNRRPRSDVAARFYRRALFAATASCNGPGKPRRLRNLLYSGRSVSRGRADRGYPLPGFAGEEPTAGDNCGRPRGGIRTLAFGHPGIASRVVRDNYPGRIERTAASDSPARGEIACDGSDGTSSFGMALWDIRSLSATLPEILENVRRHLANLQFHLSMNLDVNVWRPSNLCLERLQMVIAFGDPPIVRKMILKSIEDDLTPLDVSDEFMMDKGLAPPPDYVTTLNRWLNSGDRVMREEWRHQLDQSMARTLIQPHLAAAQQATNPIVANAHALLATYSRLLQETALSLLKPRDRQTSNSKSDDESTLKRIENLLRAVCILTDLVNKFT